MLIGVPKEIKNHEYRVGLTPSSVMELAKHGHQVMIERNAGAGVDFSDDQYLVAGAEIVTTAEEIFARSDMIIKVKERSPKNAKCFVQGKFYIPICTSRQTRTKLNYWLNLVLHVLPMRR